MIPHPTTWQAARERQRQELLVTVARHRREAALSRTAARSLPEQAFAKTGWQRGPRPMATPRRPTLMKATRRNAYRLAPARRGRVPRLLSRLLTMIA